MIGRCVPDGKTTRKEKHSNKIDPQKFKRLPIRHLSLPRPMSAFVSCFSAAMRRSKYRSLASCAGNWPVVGETCRRSQPLLSLITNWNFAYELNERRETPFDMTKYGRELIDLLTL